MPPTIEEEFGEKPATAAATPAASLEDEFGAAPARMGSAQTSLGPEQQQRLVGRFRGTSPARFADISGHEPDIDYTTGAPFGVMVDFETADNPDEAQAILASHYGKDNIGQDKRGRWWFKDKGGKKTAVSPSFLGDIAASSPETGFAIGGGVLGSALGPLGTIGGAGLGGMVGKGIKETEKYLRGLVRKDPLEEIKTLAGEGAMQAAFSAVPVVGGKIGRAVMGQVRPGMLGVTPYTKAETERVLELGAMPPIRSVAPEAGTSAKRQDLAARVSYGGRFGSYGQNIGVVEAQMRQQMQRAGMTEAEIEDFLANVSTKQQAPSVTETGRSLVSAAQQQVADAQALIDADLAAARTALEGLSTRFRDYAAQRSPLLAQGAEAAITGAHDDFSAVMTRAYRRVHTLGGGERVVEMGAAHEAAQQVVAEMAGNPAAVPAVIRRLAGGERAVPTEPMPANPPQGYVRPREWQARETIEVAHNLRNDLRAALREKSLTLTPDQKYAMISRVERALDAAISDVARSGAGLPAEAARELRRTDDLYREGIRRFKNTTAQKLVNDARDGIFADPEKVAALMLQPGQTEQARVLLGMLPQPLRESVGQAHLGNILRDVSVVDPTTGRQVISGKLLLDHLNRPDNMALDQLVLSRQFLTDLRELASEYAALQGNLELNAVTPSGVRQMLARANAAKRELAEYVKTDTVGKLASNDASVVDAAVREVSRPGAEAVTEQAWRSVTPEVWARVQRDNLRLMFADLFKLDPDGSKLITGGPLEQRMSRYTQRQRDLLFPNGMGDDILQLSKDIQFLFPRTLLIGGTSSGSSLKASSIQDHLFLRYPARLWNIFADWVLRRPTTVRFYAGLIRKDPTRENVKRVMGALGRTLFNELRVGPPDEAPTPEPK